MAPTHRSGLTALAVTALLTCRSAVHATTPEQRCQSGRAHSAAKYAQCALNALATELLLFNSGHPSNYRTGVGKCITKYAKTWTKLVAQGIGSTTCVDPRFVDNGATVTDQLTALQWEKKTNLDSASNLADPHDADNVYAWSATFAAANGPAFTSFLADLNSGGCFEGECDWRLPTRDELLTIVAPAYPSCTTAPCIDPALGPTVSSSYWSATTLSGFSYSFAWTTAFDTGAPGAILKSNGNFYYVRGVRSGL